MIGPDWLYHPLGYCAGSAHQVMLCKGYNFWSGIGSDFGEVTLATGMLAMILGLWHRHNCHREGCWAVVRHGKTHCRKHEERT